jgi:alpha-tubulin suppressor-like RCC1 family protein
MNIMTRQIYWSVGLMLIVGLSGCNKSDPQLQGNNNNQKPSCKQEVSKATDWVASWRTCSGDGAIKRDGTLWQFGKVGGCDWGQMYPMDVKKTYTYHLKGKKIGDSFDGSKIINGGYRVYAIKKDGTLWGWGEGLREKPMLLSRSRDWADFGVKFEGNGCCAHDVGLKKEGSLWIFPEGFDYAHKSPLPYLKKVGKQKGWDKVILNCCSMYAMKKDGSLWVNHDRVKGLKFVKFDPKVDCKREGATFCEKLKSTFSKMPSQSIHNYEEMDSQKVNVESHASTLCLKPEIKYTF